MISISSSVITPRLRALEADETIHWRTLLNYRQSFNNRFEIKSLIEFGSENYRFENPFRIHQLVVQTDLLGHKIKLGRIAKWNRMLNTRVDGVEIVLDTENFGSFDFVGGFDVSTDLDNSDFADKNFFMASWDHGELGRNVSLAYWVKESAQGYSYFTGLSLNKKLKGIRFSGTLNFNLDENRIQYTRARISKKIGSHSVSAGYRQKRYNGIEVYPWSKEKIELDPTGMFSLYSRMGKKLSWYNQYAHRFSDNSELDYLKSTIQYDTYQVSILVGKQDETSIVGVLIGVSRLAFHQFSYGGSVAYNALEVGDIAEPRNSSGLYGWISWKPNPKIKVKLFGRFSSNTYYKQDGRGGLSVYVTI
ncbi:MAG: hypothetical protein V3U16_05645 [Candidatus Neomarinimicrobiota bacterium]